ncbi:hypothetical protein GY03_09690 [Proteus vulgaris]|uniref:hypothetical protein n=1 Tax=Proteus vulgaris TaxID=585 RepID=UPI0021B111A3|nr:hypothetical protein [Proteus vulgaris]MCT6517539.1 hypothetical protein [Proteus vulgaris]
MDKSRQQFEEHCKDKKLPLESINNGVYSWAPTRIAWQAWQASRESLEVELPTKELNPSQDNYYAFGYNRAIAESIEMLNRQRVKIKNE